MPYHVYVIELDKAVRSIPKFRDANPKGRITRPCLYVGSSVKTPEVRFEQHLNGYRANRYARKFGLRLRPDLYEKYNPIAKRSDAEEMEAYLADRLRSRGCWVWSH